MQPPPPYAAEADGKADDLEAQVHLLSPSPPSSPCPTSPAQEKSPAPVHDVHDAASLILAAQAAQREAEENEHFTSTCLTLSIMATLICLMGMWVGYFEGAELGFAIGGAMLGFCVVGGCASYVVYLCTRESEEERWMRPWSDGRGS